MRPISLSLCMVLAAALCSAGPASAAEPPADDPIVRLPPRGELKELGPGPRGGRQGERDAPRRTRIVPGGGLLMSFDTDADGTVSEPELDAGIIEQFAAADANDDDRLTPLEQIDWADGLPTRDDTLANSVRFDPNLDRVVTPEEFDAVIRQLAAAYADEEAGTLLVAGLVVTEEERPEPRLAGPFEGPPRGAGRGGMR